MRLHLYTSYYFRQFLSIVRVLLYSYLSAIQDKGVWNAVALIDTYRSNIARKQGELVRLQKARSSETKKAASQSKKLLSSKQAMSRAKSTATINSRLREIANAEKALAAIDKKVAEIDGKIVRKEKEIASEKSKYRREEERELKKRERDDKKRLRESETEMKEVNETLADMQLEITELRELPEKITVLFMASNPINSDQLRLDEESRAIKEMIRKSKHRDSVIFETCWAVRPSDILQAINELNPAIIHFSGHGTHTNELVLQNPDGTAKFVSKEAIVQTMMVSSDNIRLVFFNTCFSYGQAEAVVENVEAAIGMTDSVGDEAARIFSAQFYSAIGFGLSIKTAFQQAKAAIMLEGISEEEVPELYVKDGLDPKELIIVQP